MTTWNLNRLRYAIRKITGKYDITQLPDTSSGEITMSNPAGIDDYINDFYLYDFPEHLRTLKLRDFYTFTTVPNCGTYSVPQNVLEVFPPIYIDNYQGVWHQYPNDFYAIWPEFNTIEQNLFTPDGVTTSFTFQLSKSPVKQGTVVIGLQPNLDGPFPTPSPALETFTDTDQPIPLDVPTDQFFVSPGTLTGNQGGTGVVDYLNGNVTITYAVAPPVGANSSCHYNAYVASRPRDALFYQQQIILRPVPNDTYQIKIMAYMMPTTVISAATNAGERNSLYVDPNTNEVTVQGFSGQSSLPTDLPQFNEWWQVIAYGAALKIFIEDGEHDEWAKYKGYFEEQKLLAQRKALRQLAQQRIPTQYSAGQAGAPSWPIYPIY